MLQTNCAVHAAADATGVGGTICPRCGRRVPSGDATDTLLDTLTQLAQFGLDAEGHLLCETREDGR